MTRPCAFVLGLVLPALAAAQSIDLPITRCPASSGDPYSCTSGSLGRCYTDSSSSNAVKDCSGSGPSWTVRNGLAATAMALAANGANCSAGSYPLGVDASGAVEDCTVAGSGGANTALSNLSGVAINAPLATGAGVDLSLAATPPAATTGASQAGKAATLTASAAVASTDTAGAAAGGSVTIASGAAARLTSGNANGGNIVLSLGAGIGTGGAGQVLIPAGSATRPTIAQADDTDTGIFGSGGTFRVGSNGTQAFSVFNAETSFNGLVKAQGNLSFRASGSAVGVSSTAPTIASGLCTSPSVSASNGTAAFSLVVGSSCTGVTTGTLTMPAATTGWACGFANVTSPASSVPSQTGGSTTTVTFTNYSRTTGLAADFTAADAIRVWCTGY